MRKEIQDQLLTFVDFIYAIVFALAIENTLETLIPDNGQQAGQTTLSTVVLVSILFYFLTWDWLTGRILTLKNPYQSYDRFLLEILIATCAYATLLAALRNHTSYVAYMAAGLGIGGFWAKRTQKQLSDTKDDRELCMTQSLQFSACVAFVIFFLYWFFFVERRVTFSIVIPTFVSLWCFIFVNELLVPRCIGLPGGPGVPFIPRSRLRKLRRKLIRWYN